MSNQAKIGFEENAISSSEKPSIFKIVKKKALTW